MKRIKLNDRILPAYSRGEEIFNMVSHIIGGAIGVVVLVLCVIFAAIHSNGYGVVSSSIYGTTIILLYTMSSIYHGLSPNLKAKKVFQIIDHCSIFLCTLRENSTFLGWTIFGIIWGLAIIGIVFNSIDLKKFKIFSMICYLIMGWCIVFKIKVVINSIGIPGFILLLTGGIAYTIGAGLYGVGKKKKWMHSIFHIFCLIGTVLQALCVMLYVI